MPGLFSDSGVSRPARGGSTMVERRRYHNQRAQYAQVHHNPNPGVNRAPWLGREWGVSVADVTMGCFFLRAMHGLRGGLVTSRRSSCTRLSRL